jgi:hypothetical protein
MPDLGNNLFNGRSGRIRDIERAGVGEADASIAVSHTLKNEAQWLYPAAAGRLTVIYNGISFRNYDGRIDPASV